MPMVLVVDDKEMMRDGVVVTLERAGFEVASAEDGAKALAMIGQRRPDAVVTDMRMPNMTGIELLEKVRQLDDELPVILMTAFGTIDTAVKAMKTGAFDYLTKPFEGDELIICVKRAIEHRKLLRENAVLRAARPEGAINEKRGLDRLIGKSGAIDKIKSQLSAIANSHGTVLVTGESGAGKEVVSRAIHELSGRKNGPFLAVNCAALSESLLESELFGHEKGAFTGADKTRKGRFELADGGTLLLDEVSEVSPKIQAKLLRVLQERSLERVGSSTSIGVDVRIIATSNRDLPTEVEKGSFRSDLYFRLNVLPLHLPSLRERRDDIGDLAKHFVNEICSRDGRAAAMFAPEALQLISEYHWPGNVRELQNICERAVVLAGGSGATIGRELLEPWLKMRATPVGTPTQIIESKPRLPEVPSDVIRTLDEIERESIVRTLERFNGHRQRTASALGIGVRTLGLKLKKWKELKLVHESL